MPSSGASVPDIGGKRDAHPAAFLAVWYSGTGQARASCKERAARAIRHLREGTDRANSGHDHAGTGRGLVAGARDAGGACRTVAAFCSAPARVHIEKIADCDGAGARCAIRVAPRRMPRLCLEPHWLVFIDETAVTTQRPAFAAGAPAARGWKRTRPLTTGARKPSSRACVSMKGPRPGFWTTR